MLGIFMCSFLSIQLEWHPAHMLSRCICFLTALLLSMSWVLRGLKLQCAKSLAVLHLLCFAAVFFCCCRCPQTPHWCVQCSEKPAASCSLFYHTQICCPLEYCQVNGWILPGVWQSWERWKTILLPPLLLKEWPGSSQLPDQEGAL